MNRIKSKDSGPGNRVAVLLPLPLAGAYDYLVPEETSLAPGDFVRVPLGGRKMVGVVWGEAAGGLDSSRLKAIDEKLPVPPLPEVMRSFIDWVADYTLSPPGAVLRMAMSVPAALEPPKQTTLYALGEPAPLKLTAARQKVLDLMKDKPPLPAKEIALEAAVGPAVVKGLAEAGALIALSRPAQQTFPQPDWSRPGPTLSEAQERAAGALCHRVEGGRFSATLLEGVTGSGKTEVYFEAAAKALEQGRQVLVLLPEIALTAQWLERFKERFGVAPVEWHSDLGQRQRRETWRGVAEGRVAVVVGARSALFLPFPNLGLIIADEEHDGAYKQEEGVIYNARDMAVVRASLGEIPLILASATPALETVVNAAQGRYGKLHLPERHGGALLPETTLIDMRKHVPEKGAWGPSWLSPPLVKEIIKTLEAGEQVLLFLNRRGYAPLTLCRACGHRMRCPHCTAWLVEHRRTGRLQCHHCGYQVAPPKVCPECNVEGKFATCGPGVERLFEEVKARFPHARILLAASDTITGPVAAADLVRKIEGHQVDILIGTQILAKGYHFPMLTLVGVIDADLGLAGGDLRAAERTYQLLSQVSGRAGRAERAGRVLIQTHEPTHPVMQALAACDAERFMAEEESQRRAVHMPPFGKLAALVVSGPDLGEVSEIAATLARQAPRGEGLLTLGPAPAPLSLLRGRHRQRLLLKVRKDIRIQAVLRDWLAKVKPPRSVRIQVDVDPYSFM